MEWERAKTIILVAFVLLNLGLAGLLYIEHSRYTLSQDRISNIHAALSDNNINLYATPMRRFAPMRHLDISGFYYDVPALLEIFFDGVEVIEEEPEAGHYIFATKNDEFGRLEISNGFISFDKSFGFDENAPEISHERAIQLSDEFIEEHFSDFKRDIVFDEYGGGGVRIVYRQEYRGQLIHSNFIEFSVTSQGIAWIDMQFGRIIGHSAEPRMIFAPDEILLTFLQRMHYMAIDNPIFITHMDIVYYQEYASDQAGQIYPAVPFYRIFIRDNDFPFLINAYTNVLF
jgi:hypothetical protein